MSKSASANPLQQLSDAFTDVVRLAEQSVVAVHSAHSLSTGFVWRSELIVTADEALADEGEVSIALPGGEMAAAIIVGRDTSTDIALLRIDRTNLPPVRFESVTVAVGALAFVVGSRNGTIVAATGTVSFVGAEWRSLRGGEIDARLELDLSVPRAAEGGLALDASGRAFGMAVLGPRRQVLVIPAATIERVAGKLQTHGRIARGYLGLGLQPVTLDGGKSVGVMVMSVDPSGPGADAGIRQGDVIVQWNDKPIRGVRMLMQALDAGSVGTKVKLSMRQRGELAEANMTIGERPET